jgi:hypothetical protein
MGNTGARFYLYNDTSMDHDFLLTCFSGWDLVFDAMDSAEVWLKTQLMNHPARTHNPEEASVFILPIFSFFSFLVDSIGCRCRNKKSPATIKLHGNTHASRMKAVGDTLRERGLLEKYPNRTHMVSIMQHGQSNLCIGSYIL